MTSGATVEEPFRTLTVSDLDSAEIESWRARGLVFLVGSFVSTYLPTDAPSGEEVAKGIWDLIFGSWPWPSWLKADFERIPFEALMEIYPDRAALPSLIQRLFSKDEPNPIHVCLAGQLLGEAVSALITTNYDLAFETCFGTDPPRCVVVYDETTWKAFQTAAAAAPRPRACFKIHGTARAGLEETLVYNLAREGRLEDWKSRLLLQLVADRIVVVIGYSGRDFDICPVIAEEGTPAGVVWLQKSRDHLQPGAERVLERKKGLLVLGDLLDLLRRLIDPSVRADRPDRARSKWDAATVFDPRLAFEWRLRVFNRLACARYGLPAALSLPEEDSRVRKLRSAMFGHAARYRDSIHENQKILSVPNLSDDERAACMVAIAGGWFIYGAHWRGYCQLKHAQHWIQARAGISPDVRTMVRETDLMMGMRWAQVARWFVSDWLLGKLHARYRSVYETTLHELEQAGAWDRLQALQHNAERIGIARYDRLPLPARRGYGSLGLVSMDVITTRDALREKPWKLGPERLAAAVKCIEQAENYGWKHELWKLCWILFWRGDWCRRLTYLRRAWRPFWDTQYSWAGRLFQLINVVLPQRDPGLKA